MKKYKGIEDFYKLFIELEEIKRTGWILLKVPEKRIESISDHTLQVIMLAITFCHELNLNFDISKLVQMCFIHDIGEIIIGDIPDTAKNYVEKKKKEKESVIKLLSPLSKKTAKTYLKLWVEMDEKKTPLAKFVHQVDKIDGILKSKLYSDKYDMPELFNEFCDTQLSKKTFDQGVLKEMFEYLKKP